jgi:signal transduction histidine kinase
MRNRFKLGYDLRWVRLLCCMGWAVGVIDASHFHLLSALDYVFLDVFTDGNARIGPSPGWLVEYAIVMATCLLPALPRFERPLTMVFFGTSLVMTYWLATALLFVFAGHLLPLASPLVGVFGSTAVLEAMAWSEERVQRKRVEQINRVRLQFTDMLVHDLKKRMSTILTSLSLLGKKAEDGGGPSEILTTLRVSAERLLLEVNNLLDIRNIEECGARPRRERVELGRLLEESVAEHKPAADLAGARLRLDAQPGITFSADRHMLHRVMTNLLWNAIQHAPEGSDIEVGCDMSKGMVAIRVANRGDVIPPCKQETMFQPFLSRSAEDRDGHREGTGLGLTFCKFAVEAHGGDIQVESPHRVTGDGALLVVRLPLDGALQVRNAP